jgi:hypothetical protein
MIAAPEPEPPQTSVRRGHRRFIESLFFFFGFRVGLEGCIMAERFGDAYRDYAAHTFRIVPGVF